MIDHYFDQYDKIIKPLKHSVSTSNKNFRQKQLNIIPSDCSTRDLTTRKEITLSHDDIKAQILSEKKKSMFLRQENIGLKRTIEKIKEDKRKLNEELTQIKKNKDKDAEYVLRLESLVNHLKSSLTKTQTISSTVPMSMPYQSNSERSTNEVMPNQISSEYINELRRLEDENKRLLMFKEEIMGLSKSYDQYNESIVQLIIGFSDMIKEINEKCQIQLPIESNIAFESYSKGKQTIDEVLMVMINYMKTKQDEYNLLLNERERDWTALSLQYKELEDLNSHMANTLTEKINKVEELKAEIVMLNGEANQHKHNRNHFRTEMNNAQKPSLNNVRKSSQKISKGSVGK